MRKQELRILHEHPNSPPVFGEVRVAHIYSFPSCFIMCLYILSSVL
jgi:hypothetical protein